MKLEYQVNTKEQGQEFEKLFKELENPPQSYFVWAVKVDVGGGRDRIVLIPRKKIENWHRDIIPAFSGDEFDVLLPPLIYFPPLWPKKNSAERAGRLQASKCYSAKNEWMIGYFQDYDWTKPLKVNQSVATAWSKADLLIKMIKEEKLIKAEDLRL